jgi:hypothetical protein
VNGGKPVQVVLDGTLSDGKWHRLSLALKQQSQIVIELLANLFK